MKKIFLTRKKEIFIRIIQNSSSQLLKVIDDILEIAMLETQKVNLHEEPFNLNDMLMFIFSTYSKQAKELNLPIYLKRDSGKKAFDIVSDKSILAKIISNILDNALKFTSKGFIEIGYYVSNSTLTIYIKDTGIGISDKNKKIIFERFSQEDKDISKKAGGLGLGLSIALESAELLGGSISLESEKGKGSTFSIHIPYKTPEKDKQPIAEEKGSGNISTDKTYSILLAEDEDVNYLYIETLLEEMADFKHNLIHAKNGREAVEFCNGENKFDLVLMDIKMPIMDGYEATEIIKKIHPDLPIIALTAYSTFIDRDIALKHGCNDFISKPVNDIELFQKIDNLLHLK